MQKLFLSTLLIFITNNIFSQSLIDTIITVKNDTISCQIKYVNNYNVFYSYKKKDKIKDEVISRLDVFELIVNNKNVTILEEKHDSHINGLIRKSTLNKKYDVLLLPDNTDPSLKILADSTFIFTKADFFYMASKIQGFANRHRSKLVFPTRLNKEESYSFNVKLYDATDIYYKSVLKTYDQKRIYFLRTNNNIEDKELEFKINNQKFILGKNEYKLFDLANKDSLLVMRNGFTKSTFSDTMPTNQYFFIGYTKNYSFSASEIGFIIGAAALGGALGGVLIAIPEKQFSKLTNFIGEFMKRNIDEEQKQ